MNRDAKPEPFIAVIGYLIGWGLRAIFKPIVGKTCEHCRSRIKAEATVCRYCQREAA